MVVIFGTLGWEPKALIPSIKTRDNVEKLVVYHSPDKKGVKAYQQLWEYCGGIALPVEPYKLEDQFDLVKTAERIRKDLKAHTGKDVVFNVTGGTKVMASAALLACILEGVPVVYCNERTGAEMTLPLLQIKYEEFLTKPQKRVLQAIKGLGDACNAIDIANKTGLKKPTVSHHVKELEAKGLITVEPTKKDSRKKLIKLVESVNLLLS